MNESNFLAVKYSQNICLLIFQSCRTRFQTTIHLQVRRCW